MNKDDILKNVEQWGDALHIDIWYPRVEGNPIKAVQVGLMDVRAADDIRIEYDFERDGWAISQAQVFEWDADDEACDPQWKEVAFIEAWASEKKPNNASTRTSGDAPTSEESLPL